MESHLTHHIARETLLELRRAGTAIEYIVIGSDDDLALQAKIGGDVQILQLGPWRPRSTARP